MPKISSRIAKAENIIPMSFKKVDNMNIARTSTKKLIEGIQGLHDDIFNLDCFGSGDVLAYEKICRELEHRGFCQAWNEVWIRRDNHGKAGRLIRQNHSMAGTR